MDVNYTMGWVDIDHSDFFLIYSNMYNWKAYLAKKTDVTFCSSRNEGNVTQYINPESQLKEFPESAFHLIAGD